VKNSLRAMLLNQQATYGSWITFGHTAVAEVMAQSGFDWLVIDLEHSVIGIETVQLLVQVIELSGCVPLVRLSSNDPVLSKRVMDAGAHGVIVPSVNSSEEAETAVKSVKYPPIGYRGVGLARAQGYGARFSEYMREIDEFGIVIVMIEAKTGVDCIEAIVQVPGVDGVFIGPYDISASYGFPGELGHPKVKEAYHRVLATAREARVAAGIHIIHPSPSQFGEALRDGFCFIAVGADMLFLGQQCRETMAQLRSLGTGVNHS